MNISKETTEALASETTEPKTYKAGRRIKQPEKAKQNITYFVTPGTHKRMKLYSLENNTSMQQMIDEAMDLFFADKGLDPIEKLGD